MDTMERTMKAVTDMKLIGYLNSEELDCDMCPLAKMHRLPLYRKESKADTPGYRIWTDLAGPFPSSIKFGYNYAAIYYDEWSNAIYIYGLRNKSEQPDTFRLFKAEFESNGHKIRRLRMDTESAECISWWHTLSASDRHSDRPDHRRLL